MTRQRGSRDCQRSNGFTLIELLVVIAIIGILAGIVLSAASQAQKASGRTRATAEIQAMGVALDHYKIDVGTYPLCPSAAAPGFPDNKYAANGGSPALAGGFYQLSSRQLYQALSSKVYYNDLVLSVAVPATGRAYINFTPNQLGNYRAGTGFTYVQDPFGFSYGYNTGDVATPQAYPPISGSGLYDLWSTGGTTVAPANGSVWQNSWISNWH